MLTCKQVKILGVVLYFLYALFLLVIDLNIQEASYGVSIFSLIKLFIFEIIIIYFYCKKINKSK